MSAGHGCPGADVWIIWEAWNGLKLKRGLAFTSTSDCIIDDMMDAADFSGSLKKVPLAPREIPDDFTREALDELDAHNDIGDYSPRCKSMSLGEYERWLRQR